MFASGHSKDMAEVKLPIYDNQGETKPHVYAQSVITSPEEPGNAQPRAHGSYQGASGITPNELESKEDKTEFSLSFEGSWKGEPENFNKESSSEGKPSKLKVLAKWIAAILISLIFLASLMCSEITFLILSSNLNFNATTTDEERAGHTRTIFCLGLALIIPYLFNFLRMLWIIWGRSDMQWPKVRDAFKVVGWAMLEVLGLGLLAVTVTKHNAVLTSLIMRLVFFFPSLYLCYERYSKLRNSMCNKLSSLYFVSVVGPYLSALGITATLSLTFLNSETLNAILTSVAWILLTVSWFPNLLKKFSILPAGQTDDMNEERTLPKRHNTYQKMALITNGSKCVGTVIGLVVVSAVYSVSWDDFKTATQGLIWNLETQLLMANALFGFASYGLSLLLCAVATNIRTFAIPVHLAIIAVPWVLHIQPFCEVIPSLYPGSCQKSLEPQWVVWASLILVPLGTIISYGIWMWEEKTVFILKESQIVWLPTYNGFALSPWLLLNKRMHPLDINRDDSVKETKVYICTTMYRENRAEMRAFLGSIKAVNNSKLGEDMYKMVESHIIFDDGIKHSEISQPALQLMDLLEQTFELSVKTTRKVETPYGLKLTWTLPVSDKSSTPMKLHIHLKDSQKVKKKKRWSQILYMSFIIDFIIEKETDTERCFILTTDADVTFTPDSVKKLLDLMTREKTVGAVCARTHPLGHGPLVWYQQFEYAIGHWFQKSAEHILGSVLCAPGCFSVYRCNALKEVLPRYATDVEHAFDFLYKDMGEDRWLCTLLIMSGWGIEYCAAASSSTYCPTSFEEFYKQRRRWITSTIANLLLLIKEWKITKKFNHKVSLIFLVYQALLLFATLVGPSSLILIVSGGLEYAWNLNAIATVIVQMCVCIIFALVCLKTDGTTQIKFAKLLTFLYAVLMTAMVVGTAEQIVRDESTKEPDTDISVHIPISVTTLYLGYIGAIVVITAILHLNLIRCILCGIIYLLCLPSGYIILLIYTVCNITDRSWGTRETEIIGSPEQRTLMHYLISLADMIKCKMCCRKADTANDSVVSSPNEFTCSGNTVNSTTNDLIGLNGSVKDLSLPGRECSRTSAIYSEYKSVEEWMPERFKEKYASLFRKHGYENILFISGMSKADLKDVGVKKKRDREHLLSLIKQLPPFEINLEIPKTVDDWLSDIGLEQYTDKFQEQNIEEPEHLSTITNLGWEEIKTNLGISKRGHINRLMKAIRKLKYSTRDQRREIEIKKKLKETEPNQQIELDKQEKENRYWKKLISEGLAPGIEVFTNGPELKERLVGLRKTGLIVLAISNILWLVLITTLASQGELTVLGANAVGLAFLVLYGALMLIQFLAMLVHRLLTLIHSMARVPFIYPPLHISCPCKSPCPRSVQYERVHHSEPA